MTDAKRNQTSNKIADANELERNFAFSVNDVEIRCAIDSVQRNASLTSSLKTPGSSWNLAAAKSRSSN